MAIIRHNGRARNTAVIIHEMARPRKSHRRDFLRGKSAVDAVADAADAVLDAAAGAPFTPLSQAGESYLVHLARQAMACQFEVFLNVGQYPNGTETALVALDLVDQLEDQLSAYREHSEVSRMNRTAFDQAVPVEPRLFELLVEAVQHHADTSGAYDITAHPLSRVWGFADRRGKIPTQEELEAALLCVGSQHLQFNREARTIRFSKPGLGINLGSIGKGYALDRCAEVFEAAAIRDFLLHGGNSSVLARGARRGGSDESGWLIGLRNPLRPERRWGEIRLRDRALATSGSGTQFFIHQGQRYGHILDPRTGWPANQVLSVTVIAPTAREADALSTAFYVLGPDAAAEFCAANPSIAAVISAPGRRSGSLKLHLFGLEKEEEGSPIPIFTISPNR